MKNIIVLIKGVVTIHLIVFILILLSSPFNSVLAQTSIIAMELLSEPTSLPSSSHYVLDSLMMNDLLISNGDSVNYTFIIATIDSVQTTGMDLKISTPDSTLVILHQLITWDMDPVLPIDTIEVEENLVFIRFKEIYQDMFNVEIKLDLMGGTREPIQYYTIGY